MRKIPVGLVGVTGYTGMELARVLANHPAFELARATSRAEAGKAMHEIYPFLQGLPSGNLPITMPEALDLAEDCRLVFLAVPHGAAMDYAADLLTKGLKIVDLSADYRLRDPSVYAEWYGLAHRHPDLIGQAVYGLPELYGPSIAATLLTANPGCYPTSIILGLAPALREGLLETTDIVVDSTSGTSGAGRKAQVPTLFCEVHDTFRAYSLPRHRHTPEIEQELSALAGAELIITFSPHLAPIDRGILSTIYARPRPGASLEAIRQAYLSFYADKPWVRVLPKGRLPETRHVRGTMFCDIGLVHDPRSGRLIVLSAIDNLCRGASGQAVACANLMCGLDVRTGLDFAPLMP